MAELPDDVKRAIDNGNFDELAKLINEGELPEPTDHGQNTDIKLASGTANECTAADIRQKLDEEALSGYSGYSGQNGASGYSGIDGLDGDSGYSGEKGEKGDSGYSGAEGISGYSGEKGDQGDQGTSGYSGMSGQDGSDGVSGYPTLPVSNGQYHLAITDGVATWVSAV